MCTLGHKIKVKNYALILFLCYGIKWPLFSYLHHNYRGISDVKSSVYGTDDGHRLDVCH